MSSSSSTGSSSSTAQSQYKKLGVTVNSSFAELMAALRASAGKDHFDEVEKLVLLKSANTEKEIRAVKAKNALAKQRVNELQQDNIELVKATKPVENFLMAEKNSDM